MSLILQFKEKGQEIDNKMLKIITDYIIHLIENFVQGIQNIISAYKKYIYYFQDKYQNFILDLSDIYFTKVCVFMNSYLKYILLFTVVIELKGLKHLERKGEGVPEKVRWHQKE